MLPHIAAHLPESSALTVRGQIWDGTGKAGVKEVGAKNPKLFHSAQKFPSIKDYTNIVHYKKLDYSLFPFVQIPTYISPFAICTSQLQKVFAIFKKLGTEK